MLTKSEMLELGTQAPEFNLPDVKTGDTLSLAEFNDKKALLVMFICVHCPYVKHVQTEIARIARDYENSSLGIAAINANDIESHPDDSPEEMLKQAETQGFSFPYLFDEAQETAKAYTAACTPDFFLFNSSRELVYRGRLDGARPEKFMVKVTGEDLRAAIEAVLSGDKVNDDQKPSMGCNIKWKSGNEPDYY